MQTQQSTHLHVDVSSVVTTCLQSHTLPPKRTRCASTRKMIAGLRCDVLHVCPCLPVMPTAREIWEISNTLHRAVKCSFIVCRQIRPVILLFSVHKMSKRALLRLCKYSVYGNAADAVYILFCTRPCPCTFQCTTHATLMTSGWARVGKYTLRLCVGAPATQFD